MWQAVRRELARLEWDVEPTLTLDLMADWTRTVSNLVTIRRALGPISTADPLALLATATTGAARTADLRPVLAPSLGAVSAALADVGQDMASRPDFDRQRDAATLNHVAYELVHWVRVRTPDEKAKAWLLAGETALDGAIHAPTSRSAAGVALAPGGLAGRARSRAARPGRPHRAPQRGARTPRDPAQHPRSGGRSREGRGAARAVR